MPDDSIEEWRPVARAPMYYEVSNLGRIRRAIHAPPPNSGPHHPGYVLQLTPNGRGYLAVSTSANGRRGIIYAHVAVAEAFLSPRPTPAHTVDHIDDNSSNNRASNLQWLTRQEQIHKAIRAGYAGIPDYRGQPRPEWFASRRTLSPEMVRVIRHAPKRFTYQDLADLFGVGIGTISRIMTRQAYSEVD